MARAAGSPLYGSSPYGLHGNVASVAAVMGAAGVGEGVEAGSDVHSAVGVGEDDGQVGCSELEAAGVEVAVGETTATADGLAGGDGGTVCTCPGPAGRDTTANPVATRATTTNTPPTLASRAFCGNARQRATTELDHQSATAVRSRVITSSPCATNSARPSESGLWLVSAPACVAPAWRR
jgi:hypothetical protein